MTATPAIDAAAVEGAEARTPLAVAAQRSSGSARPSIENKSQSPRRDDTDTKE
jgi:hypothetical protein